MGYQSYFHIVFVLYSLYVVINYTDIDIEICTSTNFIIHTFPTCDPTPPHPQPLANRNHGNSISMQSRELVNKYVYRYLAVSFILRTQERRPTARL